jgi:peroxiredoxin Q/BCP
MKQLLTTLVLIFAITGIAMAQNAQKLNIGDNAPVFKTLADDGKPWNSKKFMGKKFIVVYFYPAAMTGGCTKQACAYRDLQSEISGIDAVVVGVSGDNVNGLKLFKTAHNLNFPLLSDEKGEIAAMFGVPMKDGGTIKREINGVSYDLVRGNTQSRWTFIIGKNKKIVYKNEQVNPEKDTREVLDFIAKNK